MPKEECGVQNSMSGTRNNDPKIHYIVESVISSDNSSKTEPKKEYQQQQLSAHRRPVPNLLFVGTAKAGTTAIATWLMYHSEGQVCYADVLPGANEEPYYNKEVHIFDSSQRINLGLEIYQRHFEHCGATSNTKYIMDATPSYISYPQRIYEFYSQNNVSASGDSPSNLKVILSLREPVARELSWYNMKLRYYQENPILNSFYGNIVNPDNASSIMGFDEYVDRVILNPAYSDGYLSFYHKHLTHWFKLFNRQNMLILSYDELLHSKNTTEWRLKEFLGIQKAMDGQNISDSGRNGEISVPGRVRYPSCSSQEKLSQFFDPMNNDLYGLLHEHRGPAMEQYPFPMFRLSKCIDNNGILRQNYTAAGTF